MRQKRGRRCPRKCRSIVAFTKRTDPVPALCMDSPVGASFFFFCPLPYSPYPVSKGCDGSRGAWLVEGRALDILKAHLCDVPIEG